MRLVLVGPPGSGKGTQAKLLSKQFNLAHFATGDMLREAIRRDTPAGRQARPYVEVGQLVPDDLVNEAVAELFRRDPPPARFVLDGYPRTLAQAASFDQVLRQVYLNLTGVVLLKVDDEEIVRRLSGRWNCPNPECKATFHTYYKPSRQLGICDECGTALVQREDDKEKTVRKRLQVYHKNTTDLLAHYRSQGLLREVDGAGDIEKIFARIVQVL
jgi:adenylate kinase